MFRKNLIKAFSAFLFTLIAARTHDSMLLLLGELAAFSMSRRNRQCRLLTPAAERWLQSPLYCSELVTYSGALLWHPGCPFLSWSRPAGFIHLFYPSQFPFGEYAMCSRAVIIRTNGGDQRKWSTPYSCALAVVVVVFVVMTVPNLRAQTATTGDIAGVVADPSCSYCVGCVCQVEKRRYRQFHFHHNQLTGIVQFFLCATWTLLSHSLRCRISRDYQECNCRAWLQR